MLEVSQDDYRENLFFTVKEYALYSFVIKKRQEPLNCNQKDIEAHSKYAPPILKRYNHNISYFFCLILLLRLQLMML